MGITSKSREVVRLEHSRAANELGKACRKDIERLRATLPRGGASQKAVNDRIVENFRQSLTALRESYVRAYEHEGAELTASDVDEIVAEMSRHVQALWTARLELEPRSVGIGFRENLDQIVCEQRHELVLAMTRMQRDREFPRRVDVAPKNVYNISGPNARVNINSTDSSVNIVTVEADRLFADLRGTIEREVPSPAKQQELLQYVDELEKTQGSPAFLQRYQGFIAALADHITIFQAFLPALLQLIS